MKIIHKIKASLLRRRLILQRAENIRSLRAGRAAARAIRRALARNLRLSVSETRPASKFFATLPPFSRKSKGETAAGQLNGQISAILAKIPQLERTATT